MDWVTVAVAFVGGTGFAKLVEVVADRWRGATERRRTEVDRMAKQLAQAEKRAHLALVWGRRLELLAAKYGVPEPEMPVLDYKED